MKTKEMVLIGLMCAVLCVISPFAIPLPFSPVPVTMATFMLYLTVFILPKKQASLTCLIYLIMGMVGLPVFSGFSGGFAKLGGPTGGYLIGYLFLVYISGWLLERFPATTIMRVLALAAATAVCYLFGTVWLCIQMEVDPAAGFAMAVLPYLPLDLIKIVMASMLGPKMAMAIRHMKQN